MARDNSLTSRQQAIYDFLKDKIRTRGYGPTVREIGSQFGIKSPNGVMCHLKALEKKGFDQPRVPHVAGDPVVRADLRHDVCLWRGQIAAGNPVEAIEQAERVDFSSLFESRDHFCLQVSRQSMIEAQIADGDFAIIRKQATAENGRSSRRSSKAGRHPQTLLQGAGSVPPRTRQRHDAADFLGGCGSPRRLGRVIRRYD